MRILRKLSRRREEVGATAILVALFFATIALPLGAVSVDLTRLYVELAKVQAAADAAATAGVTYMPDDFDLAKARAIAVATTNGYPNSGTSTVTVTAGEKPTQLRVTVSSRVENAFARAIGIPNSTMKASAVADFNGPSPMGSPCNAFANIPPGTSVLGPVAPGILVPSPALCPPVPEFWGAISGPDVQKNEGSQFDARYCSGIETGCTGATNSEFEPRGYIYLVRVAPSAVGRNIQLQIYDASYAHTGTRCADEPSGSTTMGANYNDYTPSDANTRYARSANAFCSGDDGNNYVGSTQYRTITSFGLRAPVDTLNPYAAPPMSSCVKQYPGYLASDFSRDSLRKSAGATYDGNLARLFHHWTTLCDFTPSAPGDYYLQVRTNVPMGGTITNGVSSGNMAVFNQPGDNGSARGTGKNHFALRANSTAPAGGVSVAAYERMRIYANSSSASTEFNLIRVTTAARGKTLLITFFDVGEGAGSGGTVKVVKPVDSNLPTNIVGCTAEGVRNGNLTNCEITGVTSTQFNGKIQAMRVPIPPNYDCTVSSAGGCWFRTRVSFGSGNAVNDSTTWTAKIVGEPVRLIE